MRHILLILFLPGCNTQDYSHARYSYGTRVQLKTFYSTCSAHVLDYNSTSEQYLIAIECKNDSLKKWVPEFGFTVKNTKSPAETKPSQPDDV